MSTDPTAHLAPPLAALIAEDLPRWTAELERSDLPPEDAEPYWLFLLRDLGVARNIISFLGLSEDSYDAAHERALVAAVRSSDRFVAQHAETSRQTMERAVEQAVVNVDDDPSSAAEPSELLSFLHDLVELVAAATELERVSPIAKRLLATLEARTSEAHRIVVGSEVTRTDLERLRVEVGIDDASPTPFRWLVALVEAVPARATDVATASLLTSSLPEGPLGEAVFASAASTSAAQPRPLSHDLRRWLQTSLATLGDIVASSVGAQAPLHAAVPATIPRTGTQPLVDLGHNSGVLLEFRGGGVVLVIAVAPPERLGGIPSLVDEREQALPAVKVAEGVFEFHLGPANEVQRHRYALLLELDGRELAQRVPSSP